MSNLSPFPITRHWKPEHPERLQLYSFPTPNGVKTSVMLEETGLAYEAHLVKLDETTTAPFLSLNPNNKIPAILDPDGPGGKPLALWESGAILLYLAEKAGQFLPEKPAARHRCVQWLMFQMGGVGPMFGQYGFFGVFAGKDIEDPRPRQRYIDEARRLMQVLEGQLSQSAFIAGDDYTIADMALWPWVRGAKVFYNAEEAFEMYKAPATMTWLERCLERPASQAALNIPARE